MAAASNVSITLPDFEKLDDLLRALQDNLREAQLSLERQEQLLQNVKLFSRERAEAGPLYTSKSVELLAEYGVNHGHSRASKEALRSLANVLLLNEPSREACVPYGSRIADLLKDADLDEHFLYARLLFLMTYGTTLDFVSLVREHNLADSIVKRLETLSGTDKNLGAASTPESMAMSETLRLQFNILHYDPQLQHEFARSLGPISHILLGTTWPAPVLQSPLTSVINALFSLDLQSTMLKHDSIAQIEKVVKSLINIFSRAVDEHKIQDLESSATPLCTLLRRTYEVVDPTVRLVMQAMILPTTEDRQRPLGQGDSFPAKLLRLTTSAYLPTLGKNISALLFELSDKDAETFVHNIGYGYASGFLMSNNIPVPVQELANDDVVDGVTASLDINPITGQNLDAEDQQELPEMTEEEKEQEAERLFVLFEKLKATGVVDVKNPVAEWHEKQQGSGTK